MPFIAVLGNRRYTTRAEVTSVIHMLALFDIPRRDWQKMYSRHLEEGVPFSEEHEQIQRSVEEARLSRVHHLPWDAAINLIHGNRVIWSIRDQETTTLPRYAVNGEWSADPEDVSVDDDVRASDRRSIEEDIEPWMKEIRTLTEQNDQLQKTLGRVRSSFTKMQGMVDKFSCEKRNQKKQLVNTFAKLVEQTSVKVGKIEIKPVYEPSFDVDLNPVAKVKSYHASDNSSRCQVCAKVAHTHDPGTFKVPEEYSRYDKRLVWTYRPPPSRSGSSHDGSFNSNGRTRGCNATVLTPTEF